MIGGGVVGLSIAWRARRAGLSVAVADETPGRGASWMAAGMLAPVTEAHYGEEDLLRLNLRSAELYPGFVHELEDAAGMSTGFRSCGTVAVARDVDENAALEDLYRFQIRLGLTVERLTSRECRALEPALAPRIRGGIAIDGDHQVDNRALVTALVRACERAGVVMVPERAAEVLGGDVVRGVALRSGSTLDCAAAVLAAGCGSGEVRGLPRDATVPVRPVKGQLLHLRDPSAVPLTTRVVRGLDVYLLSRGDGRVVVGATVEEQGHDAAATAGGVYQLLRDAYELVPGIAELEFHEVVAGLRPGTPDNAPLIGPTSLQGLVIATGHYRNGILLAPVTAHAVVALLTGAGVPDGLDAFSPARFAPVARAAP